MPVKFQWKKGSPLFLRRPFLKNRHDWREWCLYVGDTELGSVVLFALRLSNWGFEAALGTFG